MMEFIEGELKLTVPDRVSVKKFDDPQTHKLSSFMKAVDYIIETESHILFVEIKDPQNSRALAHKKESNKFIKNFLSSELDSGLRYKYRDTWIYEFNSGNIAKPVLYLILIAIEGLSSGDLSNRTSELRKSIPIFGPDGKRWSSFIDDCLVFNIEKWNLTFPDLKIHRIGTDHMEI